MRCWNLRACKGTSTNERAQDASRRGAFSPRRCVRGVPRGRRFCSCGNSRRLPDLAEARPSRRSAEVLRSPDRRARSLSPRRRLLGHGNVPGGEQPVSHRGGRVTHERDDSRALGPPDARTVQQHGGRQPFQRGAAERSEERAGLLRTCTCQRGRFRQQGDRIYEQGDWARSETLRSARTDGQSAARRLRPSKGLRRSRRRAENFSRGAGRDGDPRGD